MRGRRLSPFARLLAAGFAATLALAPAAALAQDDEPDDAGGPVDTAYVWPDFDSGDWEPPPEGMADRIDWIRVGFVTGVQKQHHLQFHVGGRLALFGLDFGSAYFVPLVNEVTAAISPRDGIDTFHGIEVGWVKHMGDHTLLVGAGLGASVATYDGPIMGLGFRPAIRYRAYTGRFGVEISLEIPFLFGRNLDHGDAVAQGFFPFFGFSLGM